MTLLNIMHFTHRYVRQEIAVRCSAQFAHDTHRFNSASEMWHLHPNKEEVSRKQKGCIKKPLNIMSAMCPKGK